MGMAASQSNILYMYSRKNSINNRLGELTLQKRELTRNARNISLDYNNAINQKMYKWTNGSSYQTLTYTSLMSPNALTKNKNYLITDLNDKVVLNSTYADYAKMISPNGKAGAEWEGETRLEILSKLTGISKEKLESHENLQINCYKAEVAKLEIENSKPDPKKYGQKQTSLKDLINTYNKANSNNQIPIDQDSTITITSGMKDILNLSQLGTYLGSKENQEAWNEAIKDVIAGAYNSSSNTDVFENVGENQYKVNWDGLLRSLIASYEYNKGEVSTGSGNAYKGNEKQVLWFPPQSYKEYETALSEWNQTNNATEENLGAANSELDALFDAETERQIKFYDTMFSAIAEKGWVLNDNVNDSSYLNEMLQNNQYMITTVDRNSEYDDYYQEIKSENEYNTTLTSQIPNIVAVNDSDARDDALVKYEMQKYILNAKEKRIDEEMKNKELELEAIKNMIESVIKVKDDNIERTFNWSA